MTAGPMADAMTLRVDRIERQTPDILSFRLVDAGGEGLPAASAGASTITPFDAQLALAPSSLLGSR